MEETEDKIFKALQEVKRAGNGSVEIKVQDHKIIYWSYHPQFQLLKENKS